MPARYTTDACDEHVSPDPVEACERRTDPERRLRRTYRFRDRRGGFDRRRRYVLLGTLRDNIWILAGVLVLANVLSFVDGLLTYMVITAGIAVEGNPVIASLFDQHPLAALGFKVFVMAMVSLIIWFGRRSRAIVAVSLVACGAFTAVVAYHIGSLAGMGLI